MSREGRIDMEKKPWRDANNRPFLYMQVDEARKIGRLLERGKKPKGWMPLISVEVADRSLADDQGKKLAAYARAGIPVYWIINLRGGQVEVYTGPDPAAGQYGNHVDYRPGQAIPVIIDGQVVGQIAVADLLP